MDISTVKEHGIIVVLRGLPKDRLLKAAHALYEGGVRLIEAAFEDARPLNDTAEAIALLRREFAHDMHIGAGTVTDKARLVLAKEAGAEFMLSPVLDADIVKSAKAGGLIVIPGALTPTEVKAAWDAGADMVKIFPAGTMGAGYFSALKAPLAAIPLAAVGGVSAGDLPEFRRAGAEAFGISTGIVKKQYIEFGDYDGIRALASQYVQAFSKEV